MGVNRARPACQRSERAALDAIFLATHQPDAVGAEARPAGARPRIDGDSKLRVPKKRLGSGTPHGAADDLRLSFESTVTRWRCTRLKAHCRSSNRRATWMHSGVLRDALFQTGLRLCNKPFACFWRITHIERSCCYSRDQDSGACQLARLLLTCLTVIMQGNCVVGRVCCSEDTSLRGPNVFKN